MIKRNKLWKSISAITVAGAVGVGVSACDTADDASKSAVVPIKELADKSSEIVKQSSSVTTDNAIAIDDSYSAGASEGGGEGEGEGAENVDLATDDIAYLTQLALIRGHLFVGNELFNAKHIEHAEMHMKHPESELYAAIAPAFDARGTAGFAEELTALSNALESNLGDQAFSSAYTTLVSAITDNEAAVNQARLTASKRLKMVAEIMRIAGEEYAIAVVDGEMQNAHEYQDAFGFTKVAIGIVESIKADDKATIQVLEKSLEHLNDLKPHWPSLIPPQTLSTEASALYVAAAKIELLSLGLR